MDATLPVAVPADVADYSRLNTDAGSTRQWSRPIGLAAAVGIVYFLAARLSLLLLTKPDGVAVFWPASGVASGVLIALGPRARLPVAAGAMAATIVANLMGDRTLFSAVVFGLCNAGEALLTAWLIERYFGLGSSFFCRRNFGGLSSRLHCCFQCCCGWRLSATRSLQRRLPSSVDSQLFWRQHSASAFSATPACRSPSAFWAHRRASWPCRFAYSYLLRCLPNDVCTRPRSWRAARGCRRR